MIESFQTLTKKLSVGLIQAVIQKKDYAWFESKPYDLNIGGIRNSNPQAGKFDDIFYCAYKGLDENCHLFTFPGTTDPGTYYLEYPMNVKGTAILVPGQYRCVYKPGIHNGKQLAFRQQKPMRYYRDSNKDGILDYDEKDIFEDNAYTNFHYASEVNILIGIGKWSAGCQVAQFKEDIQHLRKLVGLQHEFCGSDVFSYTLLLESDFN